MADEKRSSANPKNFDERLVRTRKSMWLHEQESLTIAFLNCDRTSQICDEFTWYTELIMANEINIKDELTDFLLYTTPNGEVKVDVFLHNEDIWLTQEKMAELFWKAKSTINEHLHNIYTEKELVETETMKKFGNPEFAKKPTQYYNLDLIIAVGYRTNSAQATQFRIISPNAGTGKK